MLTAKDGELDEAEALDTGADDFLSKPFSYVVLVARLRALLRRGATTRPPVLRVGGLDLDVAARTCTVDGEPVELTPREFAVVEYLMQREGEVVPKSEILEHVWDFAFDGGDNVVEVHVSALRRKLGLLSDRDRPRRRLPDGRRVRTKWRSSVRSHRATIGTSLVSRGRVGGRWRWPLPDCCVAP